MIGLEQALDHGGTHADAGVLDLELEDLLVIAHARQRSRLGYGYLNKAPAREFYGVRQKIHQNLFYPCLIWVHNLAFPIELNILDNRNILWFKLIANQVDQFRYNWFDVEVGRYDLHFQVLHPLEVNEILNLELEIFCCFSRNRQRALPVYGLLIVVAQNSDDSIHGCLEVVRNIGQQFVLVLVTFLQESELDFQCFICQHGHNRSLAPPLTPLNVHSIEFVAWPIHLLDRLAFFNANTILDHHSRVIGALVLLLVQLCLLHVNIDIIKESEVLDREALE